MSVVELVAHRVVDASADRAWTTLTDWAGQGSWIPATTVEIQDGRGAPRGARASAAGSPPAPGWGR